MKHRRMFALALLLFASGTNAVEQSVDVLAELMLDATDTTSTWLDRGPGKLTHDDGTHASLRVALDYDAWFTETIGATVIADGRAGDHAIGGVTEAWLAWHPVPSSAWQHRVRAGGYIPPFSLEHTATGWTSPWMPTASVLNSWIGEELHVTGAEYTLRRLGAMTGSRDTFTLRAGAFSGNDTAGTVLSWRGWATNDRVTPRGRLLPLPVRAAFLPGGTFPGLHDSDPFVDLDDRPGWYLAGEWQRAGRLKLLAARYDNRADPLAFADGQAGWRTVFDLVGVHARLGARTELLAQYASGNTFVGRRGSLRSVDNDFSAWFVLARRELGAHALAARVEGFEVTDEDPNRLDDNREDGNAWAVSWQYRVSDRWLTGIEYLELDSDRPERLLLGQPADATERQLRLLLRATF